MFVNFVALSVIVIVAKAITSAESESIKEWFSERSPEKENILAMIFFWKKILGCLFWKVCLAVILICQGSILRMIIAMAVLIGLSYWLAKNDYVQSINWDSSSSSSLISGILATSATMWFINSVDLAHFLNIILEIIVILLGISVISKLFGTEEKN